MTTRNFRVNTGLSVGDIAVAVASTNAVTGISSITLRQLNSTSGKCRTLSNKKYVDDQIAAIINNSNYIWYN